MINVTEPFLASEEEYLAEIRKVLQSKWLTNNGPYLKELELKLRRFLNVRYVHFVSNGTIAIQLALKALGLPEGEVITTPFSFVATTSSIVWEGYKPVFVDVDPYSLNIDPNKIEEKITSNTRAILCTHVYGNPCDIDMIDVIAKKHGLPVIYDAAHCFGTLYDSRCVAEFGDISTFSFHATKLFHTVEGGAIITPNSELNKKIAAHKNFGFDDTYSFVDVGINGKNSEIHAAIGLVNLRYIEEIMNKRREQYLRYVANLRSEDVSFIKLNEKSLFNYAYMPVVFSSEEVLTKVLKELNKNYIYPRRYFYPSLNSLPYVVSQDCPISEQKAASVLTLPLYHRLDFNTIDFICSIISESMQEI